MVILAEVGRVCVTFMNLLSTPASNQTYAPTVWERWAFLLGRLIILFAVVYCPLVFFTWTWEHYHTPKTTSFQFLIMMLLGCWAVIVVRWRSIPTALSTPAAFFFLVIMITSLWSVNLAESWETIAFLAASMVFIVLVPKFFTRLKDFTLVAYLIGISCLVVDIYALAQWFNWMGWQGSGVPDPEYFFFIRKLTPKPVSFMGNENYTSEYLNMMLPFCFAMMICFRRKPAQLIFYTVITLLNAIVMVYIDCNATFAGFTVAIPIAAVVIAYFKAIPFVHRIGLFNLTRRELEERFRKLLVLSILGLSIVAVLGALVPNKVRAKIASMASWMDSDGDLIPDGVAPIVFRLQCMDAASRNIIDAPITGIGSGQFKVEHPLYESQLERKVLGEETLARKVHNDHLYFAVEHGIFGSFGWYWVIAVSFFAIFKSLRLLEFQSLAAGGKERNPSFCEGIVFPAHAREFYFYMQWGIMTGLIVALISCAFGHTFIIVSGAIVYWFLTGICVAVYQKLHLANQGIAVNRMSVACEPASPIQQYTRRLPGFVWLGLFFSFILPFGAFNTQQIIGETWLRHGMNERSDGNYYGMFKCFTRAMQVFPYQMETFYILGRYYIDAVVELESAAPLRNTGSAPRLSMGLNFDDRRRYNEEGIAILQADLFMNPNYKWAHNNLGVLYDRYYDLIRPGNDSMGTLFNVTPDPEQALAVSAASNLTYHRVLAIDEEQVYAHFNLGLGAVKMDQYDKAIEELNKALISDPSRYDIYKYLSNCYSQNKMYKRAQRAAEKYLEKSILIRAKQNLAGEQNYSKYQQILQYLRESKYLNAISLARLLFQYEDRDAYNLFLGISTNLIQQQTNPNPELTLKAVELAEKLIANPAPENYLWHAKIYEKIRKYDKAVVSVEDYLRVKPDDDEMRHNLMLLYVELNDLAHAYKVMNVLVTKQPDNWKYLITYARLMVGVNIPWDEIFPYVQRAIELGGDEARKVVADNQPGNLILSKVLADPRMRDLLGSSFIPAQATPVQPTPETETLPGGIVAPQPVNVTETAPAEAVQSQSTEFIQSATQ